jgi:hypothetical protein
MAFPFGGVVIRFRYTEADGASFIFDTGRASDGGLDSIEEIAHGE